MPVTLLKSGWTSGNLIFQEVTAGNGAAIHFGIDDTGLDVKFFGETSGAYALWDESADQFVFDKADIQLGDTDILKFGDATGGDVSVNWTGSVLQISPAADDTGSINIGDGTADIDWKWFGGTSGDSVLFDVGNKAVTLAGDMRLDLSSCTTAAANTDGGVIKAGTSGARVTEDTADMKFVSMYFDDGATSGDARGMYLRLYITGAGGGGESARLFTTVEDVAGATAHGAHISLNFNNTGSITGLGVAARATVHVPNAAMTGGTYAAIQPEIWSDGASSDPSGVTEYSFIRCSNGGNATGVGAVDDKAFLITLTGGSVGAGNIMAAKSAAAVTHTLRVKGPDGTTYYLMVSDTQ